MNLRRGTNADIDRLTVQQVRVIQSPTVVLLGFDLADRPVVRGMVGIPQQERVWALKRDGDPTDVKEDS